MFLQAAGEKVLIHNPVARNIGGMADSRAERGGAGRPDRYAGAALGSRAPQKQSGRPGPSGSYLAQEMPPPAPRGRPEKREPRCGGMIHCDTCLKTYQQVSPKGLVAAGCCPLLGCYGKLVLDGWNLDCNSCHTKFIKSCRRQPEDGDPCTISECCGHLVAGPGPAPRPPPPPPAQEAEEEGDAAMPGAGEAEEGSAAGFHTSGSRRSRSQCRSACTGAERDDARAPRRRDPPR